MPKANWVRVSSGSLCPICKKPDWCSVTADGAVAGCMRIEANCFRVKESHDGLQVFLHRLNDGLRRFADPPLQVGLGVKRAEPDTLHAAYSSFLAKLILSETHRESLRRRGLSKDAIDRAGYRTLPIHGRQRIAHEIREQIGDKLLQVPGFVVKESESGRSVTVRGSTGLLIPCRDSQGRIVALKIRRDDTSKGGPRYVYVSSNRNGGPGPGSPIHVPLGTPGMAELVRVTEGELKADVIYALDGIPTISVPGVSNWKPVLPVLRSFGSKAVRLAFDADAWDKPAVAHALSSCSLAIVEAGLVLELEQWNASDGKGLDDLLAAGKKPVLLQGDEALQTVRDIVASATVGEKPSLPDDLMRIQDVLSSGGPEALFRDQALLRCWPVYKSPIPPNLLRSDHPFAQAASLCATSIGH